MVGLGDLAGGDFWSEAFDVSADGSVIIGIGTNRCEYEEGWGAVIHEPSTLVLPAFGLSAFPWRHKHRKHSRR